MRHFLVFTTCLMMTFSALHAELINLNPDPDGDPWIAGGLPEVDEEIQRELNAIPTLAAGMKTFSAIELPRNVNNAENKYFRSVFRQSGGSCAQAAGIGYAFTYEINYLRDLDAKMQDGVDPETGEPVYVDNPAHLYPTHFTWNYLNNGTGSGSWYYDGWQIGKEMGIPTVAQYGGMVKDQSEWVDGFDLYYKATENKVSDYYAIYVNDEAGLNQLKSWLHNHGEGAPYGGVGNFAVHMGGLKMATIEDGEYEAGKKIITEWGTTGYHAMTFVGYDDDVKWDFNGDGQYTNDIDTNGDGEVNLMDWEIGALIFVNSWGDGWGDNGFAYMPYRLMKNGGVTANRVHVVKPLAENTPRLMMKTVLTHESRRKLRIRVGFSNDPMATEPEVYNDYKAFMRKGGDFPMKGVEDGPIEIGLDISNFLDEFAWTDYAKIFLSVNEYDYDNSSDGTFGSIAVYNLETNEEIISPYQNIQLLNNRANHVPVINYTNFNCGDGIHSNDEICDGHELDCINLADNFISGTATCNLECSGWDTSTCQEAVCGNGHKEGSEMCDSNVMNCTTLDSKRYIGGVADCSDSCDGWDESTCVTRNDCEEEACGATQKFDIPDNDSRGIESPLHIEQFDGNVSNVHVSFHIDHTYRGDLKVWVVSPSGTEHVLHNQTGGDEDNLDMNIDISTFNGESPLGRWLLRVSDNEAEDVGTLTGWRLQVTSDRIICGDGIVSGDEVCDGGSVDCTTVGDWDYGSAACLNTCDGYDQGRCMNAVCGNGRLEPTEFCDGFIDCVKLDSDKYWGGTADCVNNCQAYDESSCIFIPVENSCVEEPCMNEHIEAIPDNDPAGVSSQIIVENFQDPLSNVHVNIPITHTYIGDLVVRLVSPAGTEVVLHNKAGGGTDNIIIDRDLTDFDSENPAGTWTLIVSDHAGQDTGTIDGWSLQLTADESVDPYCGDDVVNGTEVCDGGYKDCTEINSAYISGTAKCEPDCSAWNEDNCIAPICGNGEVEGNELCDGNTIECTELGYASGTAYCNRGCNAWDESGCESASCGNGTVDEGEVCEPDDVVNCETLSDIYTGGQASCMDDCSGWTEDYCWYCGNGTVEIGETCDGGSIACEELDSMYIGGDANCMPDCGGYNTSYCVSATCGNGTVETGEVCETGDTIDCSQVDPDKSGTASCANDCGSWDMSTCEDGWQ